MGGVIGYVSDDGTKLDNVHVEGANFSQTAVGENGAGGLVGATAAVPITFNNCSFEGYSIEQQSVVAPYQCTC
jgi:hypothetical protein